MQKLTIGSALGLGAVLVTLGACHNRPGARHAHEGHHGDRDADHDEHGDERKSPELGSGISTSHAVHAIAKARCEREQRCGNIGGDKTYASTGACEDKIKADWAGDLNKYECPKGIVKAELDQCLTEVRGEECSHPFDTLSRLVQCNSSDICDS